MISAARELFRERGYHATAFSDVIERSGVPRGSTYYYFPGGKQQLAREAVAAAGDEIEEMVAVAADNARDPASIVRALAEVVAHRLESSDYVQGCAIATMVLELAPTEEELTVDFEQVFDRWRNALVCHFEPWGIASQRAGILADLVMSTFEGAMVLSRAARNAEFLRTTADAIAQMIENETRKMPVLTSPSTG
ncbi:MAG: transcriptional regulator, TetR family [Acidimicrobiaceae bacterium]|nr:transcriptional regulator, TetR family [Acidimicrobiaceae bacterium]